MRITLAVNIFFFLSFPVWAQPGGKDSLFKLLSSAKEDSSKVMLLLGMANAYESNNQDSSIYYLEQSKRLSDKLKYKPGLYKYYAQSSIVSFTKGNYELSMQQSEEALSAAEELKDSNLIVNTLANTGIVYQYLGQFDKQLDYALLALKIVERKNLTPKLAAIYHNISNAYYNLSQYRKAIDYALLSLKQADQSQMSYGNRVMATVGQCYTSLNNTDSALYYYLAAAAASIKLNDKYAEASIYGFMADTYADRGEFANMLLVSEKSLAMAKDLQSNQLLASSLYNLAYANYFNGKNPAASHYINEALAIALKDSLKDELKNIYTVLSYTTAKDGDFRASLHARQKSDSVQSALLNDQVIKTTTGLEKKYESEKKDNQIILQTSQIEKKELLIYVLIASAAGIMILFLLAYLNYHHKKKIQQQRINELETGKKLAATEAVLEGEEQERTRLAKDLHDGLGGMLSGIKFSLNTMKTNHIMTPDNMQAFERCIDMLDSSIMEMRRVAHNMMPEALVKFGLDTALKDFCNDINQSGALMVNYQSIGMEHIIVEQTTAISIYRVVQELINNTMKHAGAKNAIVQLSKIGNKLSVTVEDDGHGFDTVILRGTKGIGWTNIQSRVDFLKGTLDLKSAPGKGASVHIEINT